MEKIKLKFNFVTALIITLLVLSPFHVKALENDNIGREISETEYENLTRLGLNEDTIKHLSKEKFEEYKDFEIGEQIVTTKYFKDIPIELFSNDGKQRYVSVEISEDEYNNSNVNLPKSVSHDTSYKKLTLTLSRHSVVTNNSRAVVADLTWKKLPSTKSYDVFALYVTSGAMAKPTAYQHKVETIPTGDACVLNSTYKWTTTYGSNHSDWNTNGVLNVYKGAGISMQLDTRRTTCVYDLGMVIGFDKSYNFQMITTATPTDSNTVTIRASYQHAQQTVSLSESKNYNFSTSGYGGVIAFNNSSTASKYDRMGGVSDTL